MSELLVRDCCALGQPETLRYCIQLLQHCYAHKHAEPAEHSQLQVANAMSLRESA